MENRLFVIGSLIILILATICQSGLSFSKSPQIHKQAILSFNLDRNPAETIELLNTSCREKYAIHKAETIDYRSYTDLPRYDDGWANYIDQEVIYHYYYEKSRFGNNRTAFEENNERASKDPGNFTWDLDGVMAKVNYSASAGCFHFIEIQKSSYDIKELNSSYEFLLSGWYEKYTTAVIAHGVKFTLTNQSTPYSYYPHYNVSVELKNVIVVDMRLKYDETWTGLCGYYVDTYQKIIFDEDYNVLMMLIYPSAHWVA
jgi:hypothetical protein